LDPTIEFSRQFAVEMIGRATSSKFCEDVPPKLVVPQPIDLINYRKTLTSLPLKKKEKSPVTIPICLSKL
jgi:hypothetical protein